MRRFPSAVAACLILAGAAGPVSAQITGSAHDFQAAAWYTGDEICNVCHVPHNPANATAGPLWNKANTAATYTLYSGATGAAITGTSKLCLSCHDGTVALENWGGVTTGTNPITGAANLGTDLSNDHPVEVSYTGAADPDLFPTTTDISAKGIPGVTTVADLLDASGNVTCASCHNVHNKGVSGALKLLHMSNTGSELCLLCHNK